MQGAPVISVISLAGYGVIAQDVAAIKQHIRVALFTTRGSDPLRPEFGSNIYRHVDSPQVLAVPRIKAEILETLEMWVPEIKVTNIRHTITDIGASAYEVWFTVVGSDLRERVMLSMEGSEVMYGTDELVFTTTVPANPEGFLYKFSFKINGENVMPLPDVSGYETIELLYNWLREKYGYVGRWMMEDNRLLLYLKADGIKTGWIDIALNQVYLVRTDVPVLEVGYVYKVALMKGGIDLLGNMPLTLTTIGDVMKWLNDNHSKYNWKAEYKAPDNDALFFSNEFNSDFKKLSTGFKLIAAVDKRDEYVLKIETM